MILLSLSQPLCLNLTTITYVCLIHTMLLIVGGVLAIL